MKFDQLKSQLEGDLFIDKVQRILYSTDASQYKEMPLAESKPKSKEDIKKLIAFAANHNTSIIHRGGGTSLAGQVVGNGIVVDISKYMDQILEFNKEEMYVVVEPGVVLAELNLFLAKNALLFEEFVSVEIDKGNIKESDFTSEEKQILLHGQCQQKAVASTQPTKQMLSLPKNYTVKEIPLGCCGMAGSFGYKKEQYDLSMKIGELVLFPSVRKAEEQTLISAPGTSCRHQIKDGTGKEALHPVELLYDALIT